MIQLQHKHKVQLKNLPLSHRLIFLGVVFLPFQQALTLDLGFPLKASEILLALGIALSLFSTQTSRHHIFSRQILQAFLVLLFLSFIVNSQQVLITANVQGYGRGYFFDIAEYTIYGFFVVCACLTVARLLGADLITKATRYSIRLTAIYCLAQLVLFTAGLPWLEFVNGAEQIGQSFGGTLPRNGPFLEGNYLAMYAGSSAIIAARGKDIFGTILALLCLIYSQSTIGIMGMIAALMVVILLRPRARLVALILGVVGTVGAAVLFIPQAQNYLITQLAKLGLAESSNLKFVENSLGTRTITADAGFAMGLQNPLLGVGPGRFGLWFSEFAKDPNGSLEYTSLTYRPIANNNYSQIAAELGLVALVLFVALFILAIIRNRRKNPLLVGLIIFLLICSTASPAWTVLTLWIPISYIISCSFGEKSQRVPSVGSQPPLPAVRVDYVPSATKDRYRISSR